MHAGSPIRFRLILAAAAALALAAPAEAQEFPPDSEWSPLPCGGGFMIDGFQDQSGALGPRDIIGDEAEPAGLRAADDEFFYLRLRLDEDPRQGADLRPFAWGLEIDLDGDTSTYEVLVLTDGINEQVALYQNTETTLPDDPNDPSDEPEVATYDTATHAQVTVAAGSMYGGGDDFFLDLAVPWADLDPLGLAPDTPVFVWAASSSNANSLNGDFACHDGAGDPPNLSGIADDPTVLDPDLDTDGDGFTDAEEVEAGSDPNDPDSVPDPGTGGGGTGRLEGGGGCAAGGVPAAWPALLVLLILVSRIARRRG